MAELEAITDIRPAKDALPGTGHRVYGRRFTLAPGGPVKLGRDEGKVDFAVPEDDQISRFQATVAWDPAAERLAVQTRGAIPPDYPTPPTNGLEVKDPATDQLVPVPGGRLEVGPGEAFWIGQTRFTVRREADSNPESPVDATIAPRREELTRAQLEAIPFADLAALSTLAQLPGVIRAARNEQGLFRRVLKLVLEALPRVDAAAVVRVPEPAGPDDLRVTVVESNVRSADHLGPAGRGLVPSRKLCHRAVDGEEKRSHLHLWSTDPQDVAPAPGGGASAADMTLAALHSKHLIPWAICTPFQDGSRTALYLTGVAPGPWSVLGSPAQDRAVADLKQYQKVADLVVGPVEAAVKNARLERQQKLLLQAWPRSVWRHLDDPDRLDQLLKPQQREVAVLVCDLRNYSSFASRTEGELVRAWKDVAQALDAMGRSVTLHGGVVAGFRGDAVLGFWGWPTAEPAAEQALKAARAARDIGRSLGGWLIDRRSGFGLTHGTAVAGRLGANDLAALDLYGPVVNLAFRLETLTKAFGVEVVVADEVARHVRVADPGGKEFRARPLGKVKVKGFPAPVAVSQLYPADWEMNPADGPALKDFQRPRWAEAVVAFTKGDWAEAAGLIEDHCPDDPAGQCLVRVMDKHGRKPPPGWDGAFVPEAG